MILHWTLLPCYILWLSVRHLSIDCSLIVCQASSLYWLFILVSASGVSWWMPWSFVPAMSSWIVSDSSLEGTKWWVRKSNNVMTQLIVDYVPSKFLFKSNWWSCIGPCCLATFSDWLCIDWLFSDWLSGSFVLTVHFGFGKWSVMMNALVLCSSNE